jgi:hypothetical protein
VVDQDGHGLAQVGRGLAGGQQHVLAIELGEGQAVARQVFGRDHAVGGQLAVEGGQVHAVEHAVGQRGAHHEGMRLLLGPVRHVAGANVAGKDLGAHDLGAAVQAPARQLRGRLAGHAAQYALFEQGRIRTAGQRRHPYADARDGGSLQEAAPRQGGRMGGLRRIAGCRAAGGVLFWAHGALLLWGGNPM